MLITGSLTSYMMMMIMICIATPPLVSGQIIRGMSDISSLVYYQRESDSTYTPRNASDE